MMVNKKYITCGHVFNITVNDNKIKSECPFGAFGTIDALQCLNNNDVCDNCHNYIDRIVRISSIEKKNIESYKEKILRKVIDENNYKKRHKNQSYLYNDVMINSEDKKSFVRNCKTKISKKQKEINKKESKTIKLTDIY